MKSFNENQKGFIYIHYKSLIKPPLFLNISNVSYIFHSPLDSKHSYINYFIIIYKKLMLFLSYLYSCKYITIIL